MLLFQCFDRCCSYFAGALCPVVVTVTATPDSQCFRRASDSVQHLLRASVAREMDEYMQWIAHTLPHLTLRGGEPYTKIIKRFAERFPRTSQEYAELVDLFVSISESRYANMAIVTFMEEMVWLMKDAESDFELQKGNMHQFIQQLLKDQPDGRVNNDKTYSDVLHEFLSEVPQDTGLYRRVLMKFQSMDDVQEFVTEIAWLMARTSTTATCKRGSV